MFTYEIIYRNARTGVLRITYRIIYSSVALGTKSTFGKGGAKSTFLTVGKVRFGSTFSKG
jgi:hypothetical protein